MVARPAIRARWLGLIFVGGSVGTALRAGLAGSFPVVVGEWPWVTFWVNLAGALLLGVLVEGLAATGPDAGWRRAMRLGAGTGLLGGFTTYSTFSVEVVELARVGAWPLAVGYAVASVLAGVVTAGFGMWGARRLLAGRPGAAR